MEQPSSSSNPSRTMHQNRFSFALLVTLGTLASAVPVNAVELDPVVERMKKDIFYLAGEECEGRGVQTEGIKKAGDYIAKQFQEAGLKPITKDGSYFQPFDIAGGPKLGTPNSLKFNGPKDAAFDLKYDKEFTPTGLTAPGKATAGLVFAGYGITSDKPKYDDYADLDVKGKFVIVLRKAPQTEAKKPPFDPNASPHASLGSKVANAAKHKAAGVIFVNHAADGKEDALMDFGYARGESAGIPVFHITRVALQKLLTTQDKKLEDIEKTIDADLTPQTFEIKGWKADSEVTVTRPTIPARNIVGISEGKGPLADETIVIGAHYDHLGKGDLQGGSLGGKEGKGKIHYGADDNGSGTTGLIELARRFGGMKDRIGRRIVFVAFSGEEINLLGSKHYAKDPLFPLDKTVFMINMDMIGRVVPVEDDAALVRLATVAGVPAGSTLPDAKVTRDRLVIYGLGTAKGLEPLVDSTNKKYDFKLLKIAAGTGPSDHDSFYRKKIPVLFFFSGTHRDYHKPSDTPDKINLPGVKKVVGMIETLAAHFAESTDKPEYLVAKGGWEDPTDPNPRPSRPSMPKLGIMPGNYESADGGVLVDDVSPGGAAEKGGVKAGDIIVEIAGKPVKNIGGYMTIMSQQKAGTEIEVLVQRKEKKVPLKLTPLP